MDQAYKTTEEEKEARKAFNNYVMENEQTYGPLTERVSKVDKFYKTLADLELEAEEIKEKGSIMVYEKQITMKYDSKLSLEQLERINDELEN